MTSSYRRRQLLAAGGAATIGMLAGCLHRSEDENTDVPAYADLIPPFDEGVTVLYLDADTLDELLDDYLPAEVAESGGPGQGETDPDYGDPVLEVPLSGGLFFTLVAGFSFRTSGLTGILGIDEGLPDFETELEEFMFVNEAMVLRGDVDTDEIEAKLRAAPDDEPRQVEYEAVDESGDFVVYEPIDGDQAELFAVNDEMLVNGQSRDAIDPVLGRLAGDEPKATDEIAAFEWALSEAGDAPLVFGGHGEPESEDDAEYEELVGASTLIGSLELDGDDVSSQMAVVFADGSDLDEAVIEDEFGTRAAETTFEFDDDRVTIGATYDADVLKNPQEES